MKRFFTGILIAISVFIFCGCMNSNVNFISEKLSCVVMEYSMVEKSNGTYQEIVSVPLVESRFRNKGILIEDIREVGTQIFNEMTAKCTAVENSLYAQVDSLSSDSFSVADKQTIKNSIEILGPAANGGTLKIVINYNSIYSYRFFNGITSAEVEASAKNNVSTETQLFIKTITQKAKPKFGLEIFQGVHLGEYFANFAESVMAQKFGQQVIDEMAITAPKFLYNYYTTSSRTYSNSSVYNDEPYYIHQWDISKNLEGIVGNKTLNWDNEENVLEFFWKEANKITWYVGIFILALILIAVLYVVLILKNKKKKQKIDNI